MDVRGEFNPVIRIAERRIAGLTDNLNLTPKRSKPLANRAGFNLLTSALRAFWVCSFPLTNAQRVAVTANFFEFRRASKRN